MGYEFGQFIEWNERRELDWLLLQYESHRDLQTFVKYLNRLYLQYPALYENDTSWDGFSWVNPDDAGHNVFSYYRLSPNNDDILVICNFRIRLARLRIECRQRSVRIDSTRGFDDIP